MPLVLDGTLLRFTVTADLGDQDVKNVYHYYANVEISQGDLRPMVTEFNQTVLAPMLERQHVGYELRFVKLEELTGVRFVDVAQTATGDAITERLATFSTVRVKFPRTSKETRSGYKRIAGLIDADVNGDFLDANAQEAWLEAVQGMGENLTVESTGQDMAPVILGIRYDTDGQPLPVSEWEWQYITDVFVEDLIGTQVSRTRRAGN